MRMQSAQSMTPQGRGSRRQNVRYGCSTTPQHRSKQRSSTPCDNHSRDLLPVMSTSKEGRHGRNDLELIGLCSAEPGWRAVFSSGSGAKVPVVAWGVFRKRRGSQDLGTSMEGLVANSQPSGGPVRDFSRASLMRLNWARRRWLRLLHFLLHVALIIHGYCGAPCNTCVESVEIVWNSPLSTRRAALTRLTGMAASVPSRA